MRTNIALYTAPAVLLMAFVAGLLVFDDNASFAKAFYVPKTKLEPEVHKAYSLMPGDRLKLSFLEKIKLSSGGDGQSSQEATVLRTFYERADLSGEFDIDGDGRVSHPVLGTHKAAGLQLGVFKNNLARSYARQFKQPINIRVTFVTRPPIYVSGLVARPGAYRHVTDMTVSQAVTLASGLYRGVGTQVLNDVLTRESTRLQSSQQKLALSLVQQERLRAELAGKPSFSQPAQLAKLVGEIKARVLVAAEKQYLNQFSKMKGKRKASWQRADNLAAKMINSMREQEKIARRQKITIKKTINKYKARYRRSFVKASVRSQELIVRLDMRQLDLQSKESKIRGDLLAAQQNRVNAQRNLSSAILGETITMKNRLEAVEVDIINHQADISMAGRLLAQMAKRKDKTTSPAFFKQVMSYTLKRRRNKKMISMNVNEDELVRPGDILQVKLKSQ